MPDFNNIASVRAEAGGVGFEVDVGTAVFDVVYANGSYGFKIL